MAVPARKPAAKRINTASTVKIGRARAYAFKVGNVFYLDKPAGQIFVDFIEDNCFHVIGDLAGEPYELMPFWKQAIIELFGTKITESDRRRYNEAFWYIPRKNSKTLTVASLGLALISPISGEKAPRVYICSSTEDQAREMFDMCVTMINMDKPGVNPDDDLLKQHYIAFDEYIYCPATDGILRVISGNPKGKTGKNPSALLLDELHEFKDYALEDAIQTGAVSRKNTLTIKITTAGKFNENLPWMKDYNRAKRLLQGKEEIDWLHAIIWEADKDDDPHSPATWKKANPGWGMSVDEHSMKVVYQRMKDDPVRMAEFQQLNLNQPQEESSPYIPYPRFKACFEDYTAESLRGKLCYGGIDLGSSNDLSAFALLFPEWTWAEILDHNGERTGKRSPILTTRQLCWFWSPEAKVKSTKLKEYPYENWVNKDLIEMTSGDMSDYGLIRTRIVDICKLYKVQEIGFDPFRMGEMQQYMQLQDKLTLVKVVQHFHTLHEPTTRYKELVFQGKALHNNNEVYNWMIKNTRVVEEKKRAEEKHEEKKIKLVKAGPEAKIDGPAALINATYCLIKAPPPRQPLQIFSLD